MDAYQITHVPNVQAARVAVPPIDPLVDQQLSWEWNGKVYGDMDATCPRRIDFFDQRTGRQGILFGDAATVERASLALYDPDTVPFGPGEGSRIQLRIRWPGVGEQYVHTAPLDARASRASLAMQIVKRITEFIDKYTRTAIYVESRSWSLGQKNIWRSHMRLVSLVRTKGGVYEAIIERLRS